MITYAWIGLILIILIIYVRWKTRGQTIKVEHNAPDEGSSRFRSPQESPLPQLATSPVTTPNGASNLDQHIVVHRICPHNKVIQGFEVEQKDSLDGHLDLLTRKLAEKEGRLKISKSKIRETQCEIDNLHALDNDVRTKYKSIMEALRLDLSDNEKECLKLQEQIEWVSMKRAEIGEEVNRTQTLFGKAATELASNLRDLQGHVLEKSMCHPSYGSLRHRKEPILPRSINVNPLLKSPVFSSRETLSRMHDLS